MIEEFSRLFKEFAVGIFALVIIMIPVLTFAKILEFIHNHYSISLTTMIYIVLLFVLITLLGKVILMWKEP